MGALLAIAYIVFCGAYKGNENVSSGGLGQISFLTAGPTAPPFPFQFLPSFLGVVRIAKQAHWSHIFIVFGEQQPLIYNGDVSFRTRTVDWVLHLVLRETVRKVTHWLSLWPLDLWSGNNLHISFGFEREYQGH